MKDRTKKNKEKELPFYHEGTFAVRRQALMKSYKGLRGTVHPPGWRKAVAVSLSLLAHNLAVSLSLLKGKDERSIGAAVMNE